MIFKAEESHLLAGLCGCLRITFYNAESNNGRTKFHGYVVESVERSVDENIAVQEEILSSDDFLGTKASGLVGDAQLSGIKLNQLLVAPNLSGTLAIFPQISS